MSKSPISPADEFVRPLTEREAEFTRHLQTLSPAEAAQAAGYSNPEEYKRLLQRPAVVLKMLAELQKREVKLALLRIQAKGTLSAAMTCPLLGKAEGGPNWSDRVAAAKVVMDVLKQGGKTLAEAAEDEDIAAETTEIAKKVLSGEIKPN